ncbi:MAG: hypothetical protein AB1Z98_01175 [Nannocystaceae bacterium]
MRHFGLRSLVACSLALTVGVPTRALASAEVPPPSTPQSADGPRASEAERVGRLYVDATALGETGPLLAGDATKRASECLVGEGVTLTDAPAGPELRIVVTPGEATGYDIAYEIVYDGEVIEDGAGASSCPLCTERELLDRIDAIAIEQAPKMVVPAPEVIVPEPEPDPGLEPVEDEPPRKLEAMGIAGASLLGAGVLTLAAGTVLVIRQPTNFPAGDPNADKIETTRPTGGILLGGGAVLAITGAVLLAIDLKRRKRSEDDAGPSVVEPKAEARVRPWFGRHGAGLGVAGRF